MRTPRSAHLSALALPALAWISLAAEELSAQRMVWPPGYDTRAGGSAQELPFSLPDQVDGNRSMILMTGSSLQPLAGTTISGLAFRRDAVHPDSYAGFSCNMEIRMGPIASATRLPAPIREPFSAPSTRVIWGDFDVPRASAGSGLPPFSLSISLRVPYAYAGGDLGIDMVVEPVASTGRPTLWRRDAVLLRQQDEAFARARGTATLGRTDPARYRPLAWIDPESLYPGGRLLSRAEQTPNVFGLPALHYIGLPVDVPLETIGFPAGSRLLSTGLEYTLTTTADMSKLWGQAVVDLPLPNDPRLVGAQLSSQWFILDPTLPDPLPILASAGVDWRIGPQPRSEPRYGRTIWGRGPDNWGADFAARISPPDYVPVIEFR